MSPRGPWIAFAWLLVTLNASAQAPAAPPQPAARGATAVQGFWFAIDQLGLIFKAVGNLSGGVDQGHIWRVDLATGTGDPHRLGSNDGLAWPVLSPDGATVFALRDGQLVRLASDGGLTAVGKETQWRKLIGVDPQNNVLGFIAGKPRPHPALMSSGGELHLLPQPETDSERERVSLLLQENRAYKDGRQLLVKRSTRGGRGLDVFLKADDVTKALSDCADDLCGQPSLSPDGRSVLYVRAPAQ